MVQASKILPLGGDLSYEYYLGGGFIKHRGSTEAQANSEYFDCHLTRIGINRNARS
ncbi:hypothetical protein SAMN05661096_02857 [Marivirga sericea]|uniref:Uncharacterized protein n=1 Tax=Marivirga sericea TaxID=1028 RepID=A0A1X7KMU8_9BACT|nr:hypothetical protein SAMN05661096_02857 [Marivirga sericea]